MAPGLDFSHRHVAEAVPGPFLWALEAGSRVEAHRGTEGAQLEPESQVGTLRPGTQLLCSGLWPLLAWCSGSLARPAKKLLGLEGPLQPAS